MDVTRTRATPKLKKVNGAESMTPSQRKILEEKRKVLEDKQRLLASRLPHLYGFKWYDWAWKFFNHTNRMGLLCAANQISKSSTAIRKNIHRATDVALWPKLWPKNPHPRQFWYLYPDKNVATSEFQSKWIPEFMPKTGMFDKTPQRERNICAKYGWQAYYDKKRIDYVEFSSGVRIYFKTYAQDVHSLQSSSPHMITCDEELPSDLYSELQARLFATDGYFDMVFTATKNQEMWWRAIEGTGEQELFPAAFKLQVTMYDCLKYNDGSPGHFTEERIDIIKASCKSQVEIDRRVKGKFVSEIGRKYGAFDPTRHYVKPFPLPRGCKYYAGVDIGSGGATGHPSAITFIAVSPDYRQGWVYKGWRGDNIATTAGDVFMKFLGMRGGTKMTMQLYDQACRDFFTIASRAGEAFSNSEKSHTLGEEIINSLFANNMLHLFDTPEIRKLGGEFMRVLVDTPKKHARDDFADSCRYTAVMIPWDWTAIKNVPTEENVAKEVKKAKTIKELEEYEIKMRRGEDPRDRRDSNWQDFDDNIRFWNNEYGT
jgi:hypothetical protein